MNKLSFSSVSLEVLPEVAGDIVAALGDKKIVLFYGKIGSGKTTLIKEICKQMGVTGSMSSPTFGIVNEYTAANGKIYHFDLYRVKNLEECLDLGMEEYLYSGHCCLVEWPDVAASLYPENVVKVFIESAGETRSISVEAS